MRITWCFKPACGIQSSAGITIVSIHMSAVDRMYVDCMYAPCALKHRDINYGTLIINFVELRMSLASGAKYACGMATKMCANISIWTYNDRITRPWYPCRGHIPHYRFRIACCNLSCSALLVSPYERSQVVYNLLYIYAFWAGGGLAPPSHSLAEPARQKRNYKNKD